MIPTPVPTFARILGRAGTARPGASAHPLQRVCSVSVGQTCVNPPDRNLSYVGDWPAARPAL